jgi:DNA-binding response OmpR family regulator
MATTPIVTKLGKLSVDIAGRAVLSGDGKSIRLTGAEFAALKVMLAANGEAVSRDHLCKTALRRRWQPEDRCVDQLVFSLRQKLSDAAGQQFIHSIRGAGYMLSSGNSPFPAALHNNFRDKSASPHPHVLAGHNDLGGLPN